MQLDAQSADRLLRFCSKLPKLPVSGAEVELRFAIAQFKQRCAEIDAETHRGYVNSESLAMLRCESEALMSAQRVLEAIWLRTTGAPLIST